MPLPILRSTFAVLMLALGGALVAPAASAHSHLIAAAPAPRANVASPALISLRFSEPLEPHFSGFEVKDGAGKLVTIGVHSEGADNEILVGTPTVPLAPGAYTIAWHLVAKDGHRMQGAYQFTVH